MRFHMSEDGVARKCKAEQGKCPLGGAPHGDFNSESELKAWSEAVLAAEHGDWGTMSKKKKVNAESTTQAAISFVPGSFDFAVDKLAAHLDAAGYPVLEANLKSGIVRVDSSFDNDPYSVLMAAQQAAGAVGLAEDELLNAQLMSSEEGKAADILSSIDQGLQKLDSNYLMKSWHDDFGAELEKATGRAEDTIIVTGDGRMEYIVKDGDNYYGRYKGEPQTLSEKEVRDIIISSASSSAPGDVNKYERMSGQSFKTEFFSNVSELEMVKDEMLTWNDASAQSDATAQREFEQKLKARFESDDVKVLWDEDGPSFRVRKGDDVLVNEGGIVQVFSQSNYDKNPRFYNDGGFALETLMGR